MAMLHANSLRAGDLQGRAMLPHHSPKAQAVIQIFCPGGLSHVDTWDYRPELERLHGTSFDAELGKQTFAGVAGAYAKSFWRFRQHGQCGRWMSDLFPKLAAHVDDMAHDSFDAKQIGFAWSGYVHDEQRLYPSWLSKHGFMGHLRA